MKTAALLVVVLVVAGCAGARGGGSLIPVSAVGSANGTMTGPQVLIAGMPVNDLVTVSGQFTYTLSITPPYLTYDGSWDFVVEPRQGHEAEAARAVAAGEIVIRRNGVLGTINAPGSISTMRARRAAAANAPRAYKMSAPPPPPAPADVPQETSPQAAPPPGACIPPPARPYDPCANGACLICTPS